MPLAGLRYIAASAFFFSVMSLLVKLLGQRLPSQQIVLVRSAVSLALSWAALRAGGVAVLGDRRGLLLVRGLLGFVALSCFFYAVVHLPLADATVIQYTNPAFTAIIAVWVLRERLGLREAAAVLLSLAGVVLVVRPSFLFGGSGLDPIPAAIALAGAILSGAAYVTVRKLGATEHPLVIVFYFAFVSTLGSLPALLISYWPTPLEWALLLGVGGTTQLGQVYLTRGLRAERAGRAMTVGYLQVLFAAAWGILFLDEVPGLWTAGGALLIVAGTVMVARVAAAGRRLRPESTSGTLAG